MHSRAISTGLVLAWAGRTETGAWPWPSAAGDWGQLLARVVGGLGPAQPGGLAAELGAARMAP